MAGKYHKDNGYKDKLTNDDEKQVREMGGHVKTTIFRKPFENSEISSVVSPIQERGEANGKILTHIEEMFRARKSTWNDVNDQLMRKSKQAEKYMKDEHIQNTKYKWFKNKVMPLRSNEGEDANGNTIKLKEQTKKRFIFESGMFSSWLEKRRERKLKKNEVVAIQVLNKPGTGDCNVPESDADCTLQDHCQRFTPTLNRPFFISNRDVIDMETLY